MACNSDDETLEHMILHCKAWSKTREQILPVIVRLLAEGENVIWSGLVDGDKMQIPGSSKHCNIEDEIEFS
jgi:hypothetical protein